MAQGRLGQKSGQGFYAYPRPDAEQPAETVKLETREDGVAIAWLANGQMNSLSPQVIADLRSVWGAIRSAGVRALVIASANPMLFCAGADVKSFTTMDEDAGAKLIDEGHALLRELGSEGIVTIAAVNGLAFGGGCELAMACDMRIAARSALFGQPEIKLGILPGFGGTQRLPRLVGPGKALEMNLVGDPILAEEAFELGLVTRLVEDHELLDTALAWARRLAGQAPVAVEQIKRVSGAGDLDQGIEAEKGAFATAFRSDDAREGISAFLAKRRPSFSGKSTTAATSSELARLAELVGEARSVVALTGAGISVPSGIPDFRSPGTGLWENVDPMEVAHIDAFVRDPSGFWGFYAERFATLEGKRPNEAHLALVRMEQAGLLEAVITQNVDMLHRRAGTRELVEVHGSIATCSCSECGEQAELGAVRARLRSSAPTACPAASAAARRCARTWCCSASCSRGRRCSAPTTSASAPICCCAWAPRWRSTRSPRCRC